MKIEKFEDLECWKQARILTKTIYALTKDKNFAKDLRLVSQITAASVSVMNNIVEGFDSQSNNEFLRFLRISRRSSSEVQTCLYVALDQAYINKTDFDNTYAQAEHTRKIIDGLIRYLSKLKK
jgi:four helix bundle protein